ncbi:MAG TPA: FAD-dependent oxidoreductase [Bryobacteraceae bacterium]|jgi:3-phenylpropionate/trans-cinnamate dioxygenase ferredoxin reductase subunit
MHKGVVIAGAGQAGFQLAVSLRTEGFMGPVTLIGDEPELPYNRPPLSKAFLSGKESEFDLPFRPAEFYAAHDIRMRMGERVVALDVRGKSVEVDSGESIPYDFLALATGARVRPIAVEPIAGVLYLRTLADARQCKQLLDASEALISIGAGFIGLEAAAAAAGKGKKVTVIAAEDRPMSRVVSPLVSEHFRRLHANHGVTLLLNEAVVRVDHGVRVHLGSGAIVEAPLVIAGIGVMPNIELAADAGLRTANGISVDEYLRTSDPSIFAIGDCAEHPNRFVPGGRGRIESIQNAVDQARAVASTIAGKPRAYSAVPWFWTEQFDAKLQIAGITAGCSDFVVRGDASSNSFSVFGFRADRLAAVESINRPVDHIHARKLLEANAQLSPAQAADETFPLKTLLSVKYQNS